MRLYYDKATNSLVRKPGYTGVLNRLAVKRGDKFTLDLEFYDKQTKSNITGTTIVFAVKLAGEEPLLAIADTWTESDGLYSALLDTNTQAILDALGEKTSIGAVCELTYSEDDGVTWTSSQTVSITIHGDVYRGVEGTPLELPGPDGWLTERVIRYRPEITNPDGGTAADLDSLGTVERTLGEVVAFTTPFGAPDGPPVVSLWYLAAGTLEGDGVTVVRPTDYEAGVNERIWRMQSLGSAALFAQEVIYANGGINVTAEQGKFYDGMRVEKEIETTPGILTDGATVAWDITTRGTMAQLEIGGNRTLSPPTGITAGRAATLMLELTQDATGGRVLTMGAGITIAAGSFSTAADAVDLLTLVTFDAGASWVGTILNAS